MRDPQEFYGKSVCIDIETYDPDLKAKGPGARKGAYIIGVAVSDGELSEYYPIRHVHGPNMDIAEFKYKLQKLVYSTKIIIGANILYDLEFLSYFGIDFQKNEFQDIQFNEALIDSGKSSYSLDSLALHYLGDGKATPLLLEEYERIFGVSKPKEIYLHLKDLSIKVVGEYAKKDAELTMKINVLQQPILKDKGLVPVANLEHQLIPILLQMRLQGVRIDLERLHSTYNELNQEIYPLLQELGGLNVNSPKQISEYLLTRGVSLPKSDSGGYKTDEKTLKTLHNEVANRIIYVRKLDKMLGTFLHNYVYENLYKNDNFYEDRIYTMYHPLRITDYGTVTGRFSSSQPNLQNIPSRDDNLAKRIRSIYVPEKGSQWFSFDYSQIEYRILVNFAVGGGSEDSRKAYREIKDTDFHALVMNLTGLERKSAKICNFLLVYGGSFARLQEELGTSIEEARDVYNKYHRMVPFVKSTLNTYARRCESSGEIRTIINRRTVIKDYYYKGLNRFIQGSAADVLKIAMIELQKQGVYDRVGYPLLTVHDELDFSIPQSQLHIIPEIKRIMENSHKECTDKIRVPLTVDIARGENWGNLSRMEVT